MNKKPLCRFFNLNLRHDGGFTLVELIVVIAILAILAGVAVPVYSGYIEKTNKTTDMNTIREVMNALELQFYDFDNTLSAGESAKIALTDAGIRIITGSAFAREALENAFGNNWQNVSLKHSWGNGAGTTQNVLTFFSNQLTDNTVSDDLKKVYNGDIDSAILGNLNGLFEEVRDVAIHVHKDSAAGRNYANSGADLLQTAAGETLDISLNDFVAKWVNPTWVHMITNAETSISVPDAAALKARNTAIAEYLLFNNWISGETYTEICKYAVTGLVPNDFGALAENIFGLSDELANKFEVPADKSDDVATAVLAYFSSGAAKDDAVAYYAVMQTVSNVNTNADDSTYWNEMTEAVDNYGQIARDEVSVESLLNAYNGSDLSNVTSSVVLTVTVDTNGACKIKVNPSAADARAAK